MATHRKAYRFRMKPTPAQEHALNRMAGARRFIWNWALARRKEHYKATGKTLPMAELSAELTQLKKQPGTEWLAEVHAQALQQVLRDLQRAFSGFFNPEVRAGLPRFKSKKRDKARFRAPQGVKIQNSRVSVPKIGWVKIRQSREVTETIKSATFKRCTRGFWYVTLVAEFEMPDVVPPLGDPAKAIGIDLGLIDFATYSDGTPPEPAPKFFHKAQRKLRRANRVLSRRNTGSKRHAKARNRVAAIYRKTANQRSDFLHKLTTSLVGKYDALCIEDLSVRGLARTKLAKSVMDASFGEFRRQLTYKAEWNRKHLVIIDRFFPSSKMCNVCNALNDALTLSDREWSCACGARHKRDFNAACNIRDEGLRTLAVGHTDSNARGQTVRPATAGTSG